MKLRLKTAAYSIFLLCAVFLTAGTCEDKGALTAVTPVNKFPDRNIFNDRAKFIAGLDIDNSSGLHKMTAAAGYQKYKKDITTLWNSYDKKNLKPVDEWRKDNFQISGKRLFYPFSGPDILNALAFFPDAEDIVMIGLESPGAIPNPGAMKSAKAVASLWNVKKALRTILNLNLFRTMEMSADFKYESLSNITGIMMFFLARHGCEILEIQRVILNDEGQNIPLQGEFKKGNIRGVRFTFKKSTDDIIRTAVYYSIDLSNTTFNKNKKLKAMLSRFTDFSTIIKSASYLMHHDSFSGVRDFILNNSLALLQCDSGIPYKLIDQKKWDVSLWGKYSVLKIFKYRTQKDLASALKKNSKGELPFSYGYGFRADNSHVIIAVRK